MVLHADVCFLQAQELAALLRQYHLMSHVNLIPWNPVDESPYSRPGRGKVGQKGGGGRRLLTHQGVRCQQG